MTSRSSSTSNSSHRTRRTMASTRYQHNMTHNMAFLILVGSIVLANVDTTHAQNEPSVRVKRMYALCPPHFEGIGNQCYYVSDTPLNWLDAHFACKDRNSRLAEPIKMEDRRLRKYMQKADRLHTSKWIGGLYNWQKNKWQWGYSGRDMDYQSFSQMVPGSSQDLKFHCAVLNSDLKYRWSAMSCVERHHFVCQHRMPYVSDKNRYKVYTKWNESYPNEMANEVEVVLNQPPQPRDRRRLSASEVVASNKKLDLSIKDPVHYNPNPEIKSVPRKRQGVLFDNEVSNGRFPGNASRRVDFGAPRREKTRRRRKHRVSTTTTTTTSTTSIPPQENNDIESGQQYQVDQDRAKERQRQLNAERKAKHLRRQEERRRRVQEKRRQQDALRHHQEMPTTEAPRVPTTELTEEQKREKERLAETRRLLGIDRSNGLNFYKAPSTTIPSATTRISTSTETPTTLSQTTTTTKSPTTFFDESRQMEDEKRIRDEEKRQEYEYEQQMLEFKRKQDENARNDQMVAEQLERQRQQELEERDRMERARVAEERRIEEEEREHDKLLREQEEERTRIEEEARRREEERARQAEALRRQKEEKAAELRRLKEKSAAARENETGVFEDSAEVERKQMEEAKLEKAREEKALKAAKLEKLKARLSKLSPERRLEFLRLRQERVKKRETEAAAIPEQ